MHPNPAFHTGTEAKNLSFARSRAFGLLSINGDAGPQVAHVPFLLAADGRSADLHLMRSNPVTRALATSLPALLAISGPDAYISPDWYDAPEQVPTWNYVAIHLRGKLEVLDQSELPALLTRQAAFFEARLAPKPPWTMTKIPDASLARMMRMIQPLRLHIDTVEGTWKLSQNKPDMARQGAAEQLEAGFGHELATLAGLMRA